MTGWTYNLHFLQNFWLPLDLMNWFMTPWWFAQFAWMNNDVSRLIIVDWLLLFSERLAENFATSACDLKMSFENCLHDVEMKLSSKWGENFPSQSWQCMQYIQIQDYVRDSWIAVWATGVFYVCSIFLGFLNCSYGWEIFSTLVTGLGISSPEMLPVVAAVFSQKGLMSKGSELGRHEGQ